MSQQSIEAFVNGETFVIGGLARSWIAVGLLEANSAPFRVRTVCKVPCYKLRGPGFCLASDKVLAAGSDINAESADIALVDVSYDNALWYIKAPSLSSTRYGTVGETAIRGIPADRVAIAEERRAINLTVNELIDMLKGEEVKSVNSIARDKFESWVNGRVSGVTELLEYVGDMPLTMYAALSYDANGAMYVHSPVESAVCSTHTGRVIMPSGSGEVVTSPNEMLDSLLNQINLADSNMEGYDPNLVPGVGEGAALQLANLNQLAGSASSDTTNPRGIGVNIDDVALWYYLLRSGFRRDDSVQDACYRLGFDNLKSMVSNLSSKSTKAAVRV